MRALRILKQRAQDCVEWWLGVVGGAEVGVDIWRLLLGEGAG